MLYEIPKLWHLLLKKLFKNPQKGLDCQVFPDTSKGVKNLDTSVQSTVHSIPISKNKIEADFNSEIISIRVQFLGKLRVEINNKPLILNGKNALVLASLLLEYPREIHKETLMQRFWTDSLSAKNSLNVAICNIRKA